MIEKKHNYFYKITNLLNKKYYYGIHSTDNLEDGYMGGGERLYKALKKYGRKNFIKEIIADYPTRKEASDHEARVVTVKLIQLEECYNCRTGGDNEFTHTISNDTKDKISKANKGKIRSDEFKALMRKLNSRENNKNIGTKRTDETKHKMSIWQKGKPKSEDTKKLLKILSNKPDAIKRSIKNLTNAIEGNKKSCFVEGILYSSIKQVVEHYGMSRDVVTWRLKSNLEKWKNWKFENE